MVREVKVELTFVLELPIREGNVKDADEVARKAEEIVYNMVSYPGDRKIVIDTTDADIVWGVRTQTTRVGCLET